MMGKEALKVSDEAPSGALARGLRVLVAVNDLEYPTIARIVSECDLPKATVIRLLQTLQSEGYLAHDSSDNAYRVTPKVASLSRAIKGNDEVESLVQIALDMLAKEVKWPTEFLAVDGHSMIMTTNNREKAPIKLQLLERRRFPMLKSASGLAHLAELPEAQREEMLQRMVRDPKELAAARVAIEQTRSNGYATRSVTELGTNMAVASIAVPDGGGALTVVYFDDVVSQSDLNEQLLPRLRRCAENIAKALNGEYPQ